MIFCGSIENPWKQTEPGDIYIHTSETEGFSNSLLEAMTHGLAPIVTDIPANRYVAGETALYFPVGEPEILAEQILSLVHDKRSRAGTAQDSFERAKTDLSFASALKERLTVYSRYGVLLQTSD